MDIAAPLKKPNLISFGRGFARAKVDDDGQIDLAGGGRDEGDVAAAELAAIPTCYWPMAGKVSSDLRVPGTAAPFIPRYPVRDSRSRLFQMK